MFIGFNAWEYLYYQNGDHSIPTELWVGADAYFKGLVATNPGLLRFWTEYQASFDEPFHSCVAAVFAKAAAAMNPAGSEVADRAS